MLAATARSAARAAGASPPTARQPPSAGEHSFTAACSSKIDCSDALQAAIYAPHPVIRIPDLGFPWVVGRVSGRALDGIWLNVTNKRIIFEPGAVVEARRGYFGSLADPDSLSALFRTRNAGGVSSPACFPAPSGFSVGAGGPFCAENVTIEASHRPESHLDAPYYILYG
jgi:hypothetical protein